VFYCVFIVILIEHYVLFLNPACLCCHSIINVCMSSVTLSPAGMSMSLSSNAAHTTTSVSCDQQSNKYCSTFMCRLKVFIPLQLSTSAIDDPSFCAALYFSRVDRHFYCIQLAAVTRAARYHIVQMTTDS